MQPIYRSDGAAVAVIHRGHLYNIDGEWIGFIRGANVYDVAGSYLGYLTDDRRLLRNRRPSNEPDETPPDAFPPRLRGIPSHFPLAPLFRQLPYGIVDVFEEFPHRFKYVSELRPDME